MTGTPAPSTNHGSPAPRGLSPAMIAFIVVDVLLVIAAVALGISLNTDASDAPSQESTSVSSSATPGAQSATGTGTDTATPAPTPSVSIDPDAKQVASPSGNITCTISPAGAECAIASLAAEPVSAAGCEGVTGYVVTLSTSGVKAPCVDDKPGTAGPDVPVLAYGDAVSVNNFECVSTESGMKCSNTNTGQGFTLARAGVTRF